MPYRRVVGTVLREAYRRERIPVRFRWWLAARGMCDWYRIVASELRSPLGGREAARALVAEQAAEVFRRRGDVLRRGGRLPVDEPRAAALLMSALYRLETAPRARWVFSAVGGPPAGLAERLQAHRLVRRLTVQERWEEVTVHLGEWLIVLTETLPSRLPRARQIVADICFRMGVRYAEQVRDLFGLPPGGDAPAQAIEVLRMSEYIFRVNPEHWGGSEAHARTGWLEGTACPWFDRPGWQQVHCGIFGQFQSGISSVFGLKYQLTKTIPKHGGRTCRIDLKPLRLRTSRSDAA